MILRQLSPRPWCLIVRSRAIGRSREREPQDVLERQSTRIKRRGALRGRAMVCARSVPSHAARVWQIAGSARAHRAGGPDGGLPSVARRSGLRCARMILVAGDRASNLSDQISRAISPAQRRTFVDLDLASIIPDQIASMPRVGWLLGALAGLAAVRAAWGVALVGARDELDGMPAEFRRYLEGYACAANQDWKAGCAGVVSRHPWIPPGPTRIELEGLDTDRPLFRVSMPS